MDDLKQTDQGDSATAKTRELPALVPPAPADNEHFREEQDRIKEMIAADAPLSEILSNLVLLIESQSPETVCSVLQISDDGNHVKHAIAPSLPESYVKAIDGAPIGPKHGLMRYGHVSRSAGNRQRHFCRPAVGELS